MFVQLQIQITSALQIVKLIEEARGKDKVHMYYDKNKTIKIQEEQCNAGLQNYKLNLNQLSGLPLIRKLKIPWLFPDLEKFSYFPDFSLTMATLSCSSFLNLSVSVST